MLTWKRIRFVGSPHFIIDIKESLNEIAAIEICEQIQ